jgi:hypothetical protein
MTRQRPQATVNTLSHDDKLKQAMEFYRNNPHHSIRALANRFEVARSTLQDRLGGAASRMEEMTSRQHLSPTETKVLAEHAAEMQKLHFPLMPQDIRLEAQRLWYSKDPVAEAHGDTLGVNWYSRVFLKDNPEMVNKMGKGLDRNRATCASHAQLAAWYEDVCFGTLFVNTIAQPISLKLINTVKGHNILVENQWNMDEKGYLLGQLDPVL